MRYQSVLFYILVVAFADTSRMTLIDSLTEHMLKYFQNVYHCTAKYLYRSI